ncbi:MAG: type II secretory ATPase GspE/PulE/Tfp pilus assembly ATPase PilB-like protein [Verrucomicrobiales bacterium]|jgi:type II secretory ATPase GspE/PulE/Tfp pilus assembly ATPase PilB-like protein
MNLNLGFELNETITAAVVDCIGQLDHGLAGGTGEEIIRKSSAARILGAIGHLTGIPVFLRIQDFVARELLEEFDPQLLNRAMFTPLMEDDNAFYLALANPWDPAAEDACAQRRPDKEIVRILAPAAEISHVIETVSGTSGPSRSDLDAIDVEESSDVIGEFDVTREYQEPLAQLVALIMYEGIRRRASDIHIRCGKEDVHYCYRIDGDLGYRFELPYKLKNRIDAFLLTLMGISPEERMERPGISGRFTVSYLRRSIDIRYERHRTYRGYHATMRILDKSHFEAKLGMGSLAFDPSTLFEIEKVMAIPAGIIVMSGPTGSGKSTTLNAMLRELNRPEDNILTLENPVEDEVPGVVHCDLKSNDEFKPMITSFMRSDPDIILMGEVRDLGSAELAIEAAITGHKVLTTIHTPRASQIIERFEQLGVERWKIAQTLKAACAQRLVKLLCPQCKIEQQGLDERERKKYELGEEWSQQTMYFASEDGCPDCDSKGYSGRTAILEIIPITAEWSDALSKGELSPYELELLVRKEGILPSLRTSGLELVRSGVTDLFALRKVIDMTGN